MTNEAQPGRTRLPEAGRDQMLRAMGATEKPQTVSLESIIGQALPQTTITEQEMFADVEHGLSSVHLVREIVKDVLGSLTEREKRVLQLRFGLEDGKMRTRSQTGREIGLSRRAVVNREKSGLKKLRHPIRARNLKSFIE